jgi:hypothetical protein
VVQAHVEFERGGGEILTTNAGIRIQVQSTVEGLNGYHYLVFILE